MQAKGGVSNYHSVWRYGQRVGNLGGTARTLDKADGRVPLEDGVLSRKGVAVIDDSRSVLLADDGWIAPRGPERSTSTCSRTAATTARRCARSTSSPARSRCCPATRWATGGAATTPTARTSTSR